jgi:hypothetical protein
MNTKVKVPALNNQCPTPEQLNQAQSLINKHQESVTQQTENTLLICPHCQHEQLIKASTFVKDYHYESPHGCSGGDKYHENNTSLYICNECLEMSDLPESLKIQAPLFNIIKYRKDNQIHNSYFS